MPQRSIPFAVTRIRALETRMLDAAQMARLAEAGEAEALKLLGEWNYGRGDSVEERIAAQLEEVRKTVWELTPDADVTGLFLLGTDAHNLKALFKARLLGVDARDVLLSGGLFDAERLIKAVQERDYKDLPDVFKAALEQTERSMAAHPDPRALSAMVDQAVFAYINAVLKKHKNAFARSYFSAQADFINVRSVIRARLLKWGADRLGPMLVEGGAIGKEALGEALELPAESLVQKLGMGPDKDAIAAALDAYAKRPDSVALESRFDRALMVKARAGKGDSFTLTPVLGYLVGREAEAKALRVLFAAKRAGGAAELPALYA